MHWTALLAYRRFPANARVADDLPCVGCGYNLRSLTAGGVCPECARPVGDSLFVLAKPEIAGRNLKTIGGTFFAVLAIALPCVNLGAAWTGIVGMGILALAAMFRIVAATELHRRGEIRSLPVIGPRLCVLIGITIVDAACSIAACGMLWYEAKVGILTRGMEMALNVTLLAWFVVYLLTSLVAGWLGTAVAVMLGYFLSRWEFILHRVAAMMSLICAVIALIVRQTAGPGGAPTVAASLTAVFLCAAMSLLALGMIHLGGGAEHEHDAWDDVLETDEV